MSNYLSLFCGCGGLDIGFEQESWEPALAIDIRPHAITSFNANREKKVGFVADLRSTKLSDLDRMHGGRFNPMGVIGGPPCQSFSRANSRKSSDDNRGELVKVFFDLALSLHRREPIDFIAMENVPEVMNPDLDRPISKEIARLERHGFHVSTHTLDASSFGVPQRRKRLFLIAINRRKMLGRPDPADYACENRVNCGVIRDLSKPVIFSERETMHTVRQHPNHWCMTPNSRKFTEGLLKPGESFGRSFRTLDFNSISPTISYGNREVHVHPNGKRRLSVFESMILQGFPREYVLAGNLSQQFSQVSESVSPPVARAICRSIKGALKSDIAS